MTKRNVFIVVSSAIPVIEKMNTLATKVTAACLRASKAETLSKITKENQEEIVYGLQCKIYTTVVEAELDGEIIEGPQEIYIIVSAAIPIQKGMNPVKSNIHSACMNRNKAEEIFNQIRTQKNITVNGILCEAHASIIPIQLDKS